MKKINAKQQALAEFRRIPGVGKSIAEDFWNIGLRSLHDLKNADPENLYKLLCNYQQCTVDRCVLYVFRCAVYFASTDKHDPGLLQWWHWKD